MSAYVGSSKNLKDLKGRSESLLLQEASEEVTAEPAAQGFNGTSLSRLCRGASLIRNRLPLGPYSRLMHKALGGPGRGAHARGSPVRC